MTYSYQSGPLTYGPQQGPVFYDTVSYKKPSALPVALGTAVIGGGVGAIMAGRKKPYINKNGEAIDSFAEKAYERYMKKEATDEAKKIHAGNKNIMKGIDSVKTPEELKTLLSNNKEAAEKIYGSTNQSVNDILKNITQDNLSENKKTIKNNIKTSNETNIRDMKNKIQACWDKEKKKFAKADSVDDKFFKSIKKSTSGFRNKIIGKYAAIGAAIAGAVGFIAGKIFIK